VLARVQLTLAAGLVLVAVGLAAVLLFGPDGKVTTADGSSPLSLGPTGWYGAEAPPGIRRRDFTLENQDGRTVSLAADRGKVVVLTFMYSTCLDSCPATAQTIRLALNDLGGRVKGLPVYAVSVDPVQDSPKNTKNFLLKQSLTGRMDFLRGTQTQLAPVWKQYAVRQQKPGTKQSDSHSVGIYIIGRDGKQRVRLDVDTVTPEALAHDLGRVLAEKS
jgi:protein SCO1/2